MKEYWIRCPLCGYPKMIKARDDTVLKNFPGYCKSCKRESIITILEIDRIKQSQIITEP